MLFAQKKYPEALDQFLDAYLQKGSRPSLLSYIDECLRQTREPWLAASRPPKWDRLLALLAERRQACASLAGQNGVLISNNGAISVRFPAARFPDSRSPENAARLQPIIADVRRILLTLPEPGLVITCEGSSAQGPEMNALRAAASRIAQTLVREKVLPAAALSIRQKETREGIFCTLHLGTGRSLAAFRTPDSPPPAITSSLRSENGKTQVDFTLYLTEAAPLQECAFLIYDREQRLVETLAGSGIGYLYAASWSPKNSLSGEFTPVARTNPGNKIVETPGTPFTLKSSIPEPAVQIDSEPAHPAPSAAVSAPRTAVLKPVKKRYHQKIMFEDGTARIKELSLKYIRVWGRDILPTNPGAKALIVGCCTRDEAKRCPTLAEDRARAVKTVLSSEFNVSLARLEMRAGTDADGDQNAPAAIIFLEESHEAVP